MHQQTSHTMDSQQQRQQPPLFTLCLSSNTPSADSNRCKLFMERFQIPYTVEICSGDEDSKDISPKIFFRRERLRSLSEVLERWNDLQPPNQQQIKRQGRLMEDTSDTSVTSSCFCFLDDSDEKSPAQRLSACSLPSWQEEDGEEEKSSNEGDAGNEDDDEQEQQVEENESQFLTGQGGEIYNEDLVIDDELEFLANRFDNNPIDDRDHEKNLVEPTMIDESNRWGSDDSMGPPQPPKPMPALIPVMRSNTPTTYVNRRSDNLLDDVQSFSSHNSEESLDNDDLLLGLSPEEKEEAKADSRPSSRADSYSTWSTCYDQQEFSSSHTLSSGDSSSSSCQRIPKNLVFTPPDHPNQKARRSPFQADLEFEKQGSNSSLFYPLPFFVQDRRKFLLEKRMNSLRGRFAEVEDEEDNDVLPAVPSRRNSGSTASSSSSTLSSHDSRRSEKRSYPVRFCDDEPSHAQRRSSLPCSLSGQRANGASKETTRRNSVDMTLLQSLQLKPASSWAQLDTAEITSANTAAATYDQAPSVPRRHESGECHRQWDISPPPPPKPKSNGTIDTRPTRPRRNISAEISSHGSLAFSSEDDDTEDGATVGSSKDPPVELQQFMTIPSTDGKEDENPEKEPDCEPVRSCPSKFSMPEDIKEENPSAATSPRTPCPSVDDVPLPNKSHPTPALTRGMPRRRSNVMLSMKLQKSLKGSNLTKLLQDEGTSQPIQPARTKEPPSLVIPSPKRLSLPVTIEEERDLIASSASNSSSKHPNSMSIPRLPSLSSRKRLSLPEAKLESSMRRKLPKMSSLSSLTSSWRSRTMAAENRRRLGEKRDVDAAEDSVVTRPPIITDDLLVTKNGVAAAPLPGASLSGDDGNSSSTIKTNHLALTQTIITPRIPGNDGAKTLVELPDGSRVSIAELTRLLMDSLPRHEATSVAGDGRPYYFFHGSEGLDVMRKLFFQTAPDDDAAVISFGMALEGSDFGHLIHNMTPNVEYKDAVLVLQPLLKPHVLNSLIDLKTNNAASTKRPGYKTPELKATQIMLELSMLMDQIFVAASDGVTKSFNQRLVRKFEESVVYLQLVNIRFRSSDERVAFTVNLYNCMMRHALVIRNRAKYLPSWPQQHNDLHEFMSNIQYNIGGKLVSLLDVHVSLLENIDITKIFVDGKDKHKVATGRRPPSRPWWRKMLLSGILGCRQKASASSAQKQTPTTDSRIIFCITFGTTSSPQVRTIDPCYLERDLQYAAQSFCEQHITVRIIKQKGCTIKIPQLLDWYASKLGATGSNKDNIMEKLVRFLSPDQIKKLNTFSGNHPNSKWKIRFQKHNWDIPETPLPPLQLPLPALREQNNSEALSQRLSLTSEPLEGVTLTFPEPRSRRNQHQAPDQDDSKSLFSEITMESELVGMSTKGFHFQSRRGPMTVASHPNQA